MKRLFFTGLLILSSFSFSGIVHAQSAGEVVPDKVEVVKAQVIKIESQGTQQVVGTDITETSQVIDVKVLEGSQAGQTVTVDNDYINLNVGEIFYLNHTSSQFDGKDYYSVDQPYRLPQLAVLAIIFLIILLLFGGIQGLRGLLSLIFSFILIFYVLLPGILHGNSPVLITIGVASIIIIVGSYITHGFNKTTSAAVAGMIVTVVVTGLLSYWAVHFTRLTGFGTEEATFLNLNTKGSIDMLGILFSGIIIGLLGVLYDIAISQAIAVEELLRIAPDVSKNKIYERAIRIGREHIGALVNTLAIAYVGVALPLLLLFYVSDPAGAANIVNRELFSAEIVRILMGSIGIILAVPITTIIAINLLAKKKRTLAGKDEIEKEEEKIKKVHTSHF